MLVHHELIVAVMGRVLTVCATVGSLAVGVAWLVALVYMIQLGPDTCQAPSSSSSTLPHLLSMQAFSITSLTVTAFVFTVFFLQLFYHERLAHEVLLEDLADAAATTHFHSLLTSLCSSFTHTLLLLFNLLITLTLILFCFLGMSAVEDILNALEHPDECMRRVPLGLYLIVLDFVGACMFFVSTGWRCISRCWTDEDTAPTNSGPGSGNGVVGGLMRAAADARNGGDKKGKGRKRNVKYSAVEGEDEADDDELFDADALDGGSDDHSDIQRGLQMTAAEEDVEMMDMLDKHSKPTTPAAAAGGVVVAGKSVPSILPPPRVSDEAEVKESRNVGLPGDVDTEDDYDYGDIEEGDDEGEQKQK